MSSREVGSRSWLATRWLVTPGCGQSGTPPAPFTAGRCYCPPQAVVFVKIRARDPATPPCPPAIAPAGWYSSPSFSFMSSSPSCLQLGGGNPRTPCRLLIHQGACRPLDPLLMEKFGPRVSLSLSLSAPPSSPSCLQLGGGSPRTSCQPSYSPRGVPPPGPPAVGDSVLGLLILCESVDQVVIVSCTVNK